MNVGNNIIIVSGSRLRRISEDGKRLLDQTMQEGALIEYDTAAKVVNIVESQDKAKAAVIVDVIHNGVKLTGWVYPYECTHGR